MQKRGIKKNVAQAYIESQEAGVPFTGRNPEDEIHEGDSVVIDVEKIKSRTDYDKMDKQYRSFVEENEGVTFTAHFEKNQLVALQENPRWLFWNQDLKKVKNSDEES